VNEAQEKLIRPMEPLVAENIAEKVIPKCRRVKLTNHDLLGKLAPRTSSEESNGGHSIEAISVHLKKLLRSSASRYL
jgi:hypothetical protein